MGEDMQFDALVERFYRPLYQFAFSLTRTETDACDLTQQTFYVWASKGHQLRDPSKVKSWLFTTLHREFLNSKRRQERFPHHELSEVEFELPSAAPSIREPIDGQKVLEALGELGEAFRAPVILFYLRDFSYKEIAEILEIPIGTVKSRLARGLIQLQDALAPPKKAELAFKKSP